MDAERIERSLREGPPDEPIYRPGAFHEQPPSWLVLIAAGAVVGMALVVGVVAGLGLDVLRNPSGSVGGPVDVDRLAAELEGRWSSDDISREAWIQELSEMGYRQADIDFALSNLPAHERVRYDLVFQEDHLQIFASFDGSELEPMSGGPYQLLPNGALYYDDVACYITVLFDIKGERLAFEPMRTDGCNADESLNNAAYFNLLTYERDAP